MKHVRTIVVALGGFSRLAAACGADESAPASTPAPAATTTIVPTVQR